MTTIQCSKEVLEKKVKDQATALRQMQKRLSRLQQWEKNNSAQHFILKHHLEKAKKESKDNYEKAVFFSNAYMELHERYEALRVLAMAKETHD